MNSKVVGGGGRGGGEVERAEQWEYIQNFQFRMNLYRRGADLGLLKPNSMKGGLDVLLPQTPNLDVQWCFERHIVKRYT